ncbi:ABC transporter ATP-binding protein [bacterium]|nr:ABC transporter ATP-binding protein [bacterium]MBU1153148.1 ABC transporter ATP-binding protein [bacterium]
MNPNFIELSEIKKIYTMGKTDFLALKGISLSIARGEFIAIMGASGSGKSTLMNIIGCLDNPTTGTYLLDGEDVITNNDKELARIRNKKIGFVFQFFNLLGKQSALDNVMLPLLYSGFLRKNRRKIASEALEMVGLSTKLRNKPSEMSGGEQQRVAIARALVNNPEIICADEPTGNLDSQTSHEIMEILLGLNKKGRTIILVTHEADIAGYAQRIIRMKDGGIVEL